MTGATLHRLPFTKALRTMLAEQLGKPVEIRRIPTVPKDGNPETQIQVRRPYAILYPLWRSMSGPPFAEPDVDAEWTYQVSLFAERGDQLEWMADRVMGGVLDRAASGAFVHPVTVDGIYCSDRTLKEDNGGDLTADEPPQLDLRFGFNVSPRSA